MHICVSTDLLDGHSLRNDGQSPKKLIETYNNMTLKNSSPDKNAKYYRSSFHEYDTDYIFN